MVKGNVLVIGGDETGYHDFRVLGPIFKSFLTDAGFYVTLSEDLNMFLPKYIKSFDIIVCYMNKVKINKSRNRGSYRVLSVLRGAVRVSPKDL